jgi:hypothetical protein
MVTKWKATDVFEGGSGSGIGGDDTVGGHWTVLYLPEPAQTASPFARIEESYYIRHYDTNPEFPFAVESQTEYLVCTDLDDPGGTETWSTIGYDSEAAGFNDRTLENAEQRAKGIASAQTGQNFLWNGEPK